MNATDLDIGVNAEIRYRIQQGSFDDFAINNRTGVVTITRKLDYDKRNTYNIGIVAADQGKNIAVVLGKRFCGSMFVSFYV